MQLDVVIPLLRRGAIGVMPTDTIYGIVGSAKNPRTAQKIYALRKRNPAKPMIILIGDAEDIRQFGVRLDAKTRTLLRRLWPGQVSIVLPISSRAAFKKFSYLHRGSGTLAFRLPKPSWLRALLKKTGPLLAPSANFEGKPAARTIVEAKKYFKDKIAFYADVGLLSAKPSTLVAVEGGFVTVLRPGAVKIRF